MYNIIFPTFNLQVKCPIFDSNVEYSTFTLKRSHKSFKLQRLYLSFSTSILKFLLAETTFNIFKKEIFEKICEFSFMDVENAKSAQKRGQTIDSGGML